VEARDRVRKGNSYNEEGVEVQVQEGRDEMMSEPLHREILMFEDMIYCMKMSYHNSVDIGTRQLRS